jgi:hypothetical protein
MIEATDYNFNNEPQYLTPEAREDARKARKEVWVKSMSFLSDRNSGLLISNNPNYWGIAVRTMEPSKKKPMDLEIEKIIIKDGGHNVLKKEIFSFHIDGGGYVTKTVRLMNENKKMVEAEIKEIGRAELEELLETLKKSRKIEEGFV